MMCLSQTTGYAVQALGCLQDEHGEPQRMSDISRCAGVPQAYLAQIMNRLAHKGIVSAKRGYRGGITLARPAKEIALLEVVKAIEGNEWMGPCLLGMTECSARMACPTHDLWLQVRGQIEETLRQTTLADVIQFAHRHPTLRPGFGEAAEAPSI